MIKIKIKNKVSFINNGTLLKNKKEGTIFFNKKEEIADAYAEEIKNSILKTLNETKDNQYIRINIETKNTKR